LFRLGRGHAEEEGVAGTLLDGSLRDVWPVLLAVYVFNAFFVVMNYQFVNTLIFTLAGVLAAQNRRVLDAATVRRAW
jgi:hypothetical protein